MDNLIAATVAGLSAGNVWICALTVFSLQSADKGLGLGYIAGRFVGVTLFTIAVWLVGTVLMVPHTLLSVVTGVVLMALGLIYLTRQLHRKGKKNGNSLLSDKSQKCDHDCKSCPVTHHVAWSKWCTSCDSIVACQADSPEVEPLTRHGKPMWGRRLKAKPPTGLVAGLGLGIVRGSAMCQRLVALVPLVLEGSATFSVAVGFVFALSSSIYPIAAYLVGAKVLRLLPHRAFIVSIVSVLLCIMGAYYIARAVF